MSLLRAFAHAQCAIPPFPHPPGASLGTTSVKTPVLSYSPTHSSHYSLHLYVYLRIYLSPQMGRSFQGQQPVSSNQYYVAWGWGGSCDWLEMNKKEPSGVMKLFQIWIVGWFYNSINVLKSMNYIFMSGFHVNRVPKLSHCLAHSKYPLNNCWKNDFMNI